MKAKIYLLGITISVLVGLISLKQPTTTRQPAAADRVFNYTYKGKPLKLSFQGVSWETALKEGARKCMDYYTEGKGPSVGEEIWLDLIDVCVNPR